MYQIDVKLKEIRRDNALMVAECKDMPKPRAIDDVYTQILHTYVHRLKTVKEKLRKQIVRRCKRMDKKEYQPPFKWSEFLDKRLMRQWWKYERVHLPYLQIKNTGFFSYDKTFINVDVEVIKERIKYLLKKNMYPVPKPIYHE